MSREKAALSIAGFDSSGGAGVLRDVRTFDAMGVRSAAAVTAVTAQDDGGVHAVHPVPADTVQAQVEAAFRLHSIGAIKIGMLVSNQQIACLRALLPVLSRSPAPVVIDPVLKASNGGDLCPPDLHATLASALFPLADVVCPNAREARNLAAAAGDNSVVAWAERQPCAVLITGGDEPGDHVVDVLYASGRLVRRWERPRIQAPPARGTGCTLSSALAARLLIGEPLEDAITFAIQATLRHIMVKLGA